MSEVISVINIFLLFAVLIGVGQVLRKLNANTLLSKMDVLESLLGRVDNSLVQQMALSRDEQRNSLAAFGEQINQTSKSIGSMQKEQLESFSRHLSQFQEQLKLDTEALKVNQANQAKGIEERLEKMRGTVEERLKSIQNENSGKLEEMRKTVDEKLHDTLEKRLSESFKQVSERLEQVHKGLGEMQTLAVGVGDLKKVLSNVKTKGIIGEYQLAGILEEILSREQYEANVATKKGSRDNVEFAVRLPGKDNNGEIVYLPIDSKFPTTDYYGLLEAYELGDTDKIQERVKAIEMAIKRCAKDIRDKYIDPPATTEFGVMFLPFEGLYAEIVRRPELVESLQHDYKVIVAGPSTLAALLNSLQMGFKTLAIEKRSSEVWRILGAVKTEFAAFNDVLKKAQDKINKASQDIDVLVGTRTRKIQGKLREVEALPATETTALLGSIESETEDL
ncbi:MAG: DNA recombination protein RmuC [Deltaproteobacteria bacterium]|nr:DNA recombination protein RmuC [Deltaproteobacteria bacterium]